MSEADTQTANQLFVDATLDESGLTFPQIIERLDSVGYWKAAGLEGESNVTKRKHTRLKLRSLHIDGLPVFSAFRQGKYVP
jgi:hypothetical protein